MKNLVPSLKAGWIVLIILLGSCTGKTLYHENVDFPKGYWSSTDTLHFKVLVADTLSPCNITLLMRNKGAYPFSNLYVVVTTQAPSGAVLTDTIEFILASPRGEWLGKGFGDVWQNEKRYKTAIRFPNTGIYSFSIRQIMRPDQLPGVMDFGLRIDRSTH